MSIIEIPLHYRNPTQKAHTILNEVTNYKIVLFEYRAITDHKLSLLANSFLYAVKVKVKISLQKTFHQS